MNTNIQLPFSLFLLFLCVSHFPCFDAAPLGRTRNLVQHQIQGYNNQGLEKIYKLPSSSISEEIRTEEGDKMKPKTGMRINIELHDYPGIGANNRHTPNKP
ncbi:uncharacterized protein LOC124933091 [Impatiens glandulifera]|uniref:uncharacterized protein LOC124933091 n=1 Tax=Impatiens glandulifera TaxID=253017 RepID=UPI001FB150FF|nr:uncharacterized protein LOC124933091 [Impatiens glandulifera]